MEYKCSICNSLIFIEESVKKSYIFVNENEINDLELDSSLTIECSRDHTHKLSEELVNSIKNIIT